MSAASELSRAIYQRCREAESLRAIVGSRIYDRVPDSTPVPYVTLGALTSRPIDAEGVEEHLVVLDAWSRGHGRREVQAMLDAVRAALIDVNLDLGQTHLVALAHLASEVVADNDTDLEHGICRLRAVTQPNEF